MASEFNGFPQAFFRFFTDLSKNNNRDWFNDNKSRYEDHVVAPLLGFIEAIRPGLKKVSPHYQAIAKKTGGSMFRIYRDTRFSKDAKPYKEHGACQFRHELGKDAHAPGFYVHLQPGKIFFGGGVWVPPPKEMLAIRETIADSPAAWGRIINSKTIRDTFGGIRGDGLKTAPKGFPKDHKHIEDLRRKSWFLMREAKPALAKSPEFVDEVLDSFKKTKPLLSFICHALDVPF